MERIRAWAGGQRRPPNHEAIHSSTQPSQEIPEPPPVFSGYNRTTLIGQTISHYRIIERRGEGGRVDVYKAEDTELERTVVLKFLSSETVDNDEFKGRLTREAQALASLDHPNICRLGTLD